ncbi:phosphoribosylaminoimidazole-succinocarboxamide synthase-like [Oppia nitens]|uniref:phosphoribosylaminoimidazole-succinocarboxamide synthase-like n=1 Tax=Oppia nitens TaxID=1686743 RepID=UPI0023D9F0D0|nr:phosphoribosylaminoimidazole-succinocarboxamide synthase-like [Oppia nitens]
MDINQSLIGDLISEGKTKQVYHLKNDGTFGTNDSLVYVKNKDNISAGDNSRNRRIMLGKGRITCETSSAIFGYLNAVGLDTAFIARDRNCDNGFVAKHCQMIPIELVIRRIAMGTYLKLNPDVSEGYRFLTPLVEIHIKDDANHDPLWSVDRLVGEQFVINGLSVDRDVIDRILKLAKLVYEILERVWHTIDYQLVDLKVEFGVVDNSIGDTKPRLVLADIIDNETWRLWPSGDKKQMVDKQIYREYSEGQVDDQVIDYVRTVFQNVSDLTQQLFSLEKKSKKCLKYLPKESIIILTADESHTTSSEDNHCLAQNLSKYLHNEYNISGITVQKIGDHCWQQLVDKLSQSYCQLIVTIGCIDNDNYSSKIATSVAIPVIDYCYDVNHNSLLDPKLLDKNLVNQIIKIMAINDQFIWSKIKLRQCFDSTLDDN